jgi:outer membrane phospholipase A
VSGFYLAYSQTSFWDIGGDSNPFFDTSYRPELLYLWEQSNPAWLPGMTRFDVEAGLRHNSNGRGGDDSRTINTVYVRPVFTFGDPGTGRGFFLAVAPELYEYLGALRDNPDAPEFFGYGNLRLIAGWRGGLQLAAMGRLGSTWDKGALQLDLTYPLRKLTRNNLDLYLDAQFFTGYGESLLEYNQSTTSFRLGVALVR